VSTLTAGIETGQGQIAITWIPPPLVSTSAVSSITSTTATTGGFVSFVPSSSITTRGVVWDTGTQPLISLHPRTTQTGIFSTGAFSTSISSLLGFTNYSIRAYAITENGAVGYGSTFQFSTLRSLPVVSTVSVSTFGASTYLVTSLIETPGDEGVLQRGVIWDTTSTLTLSLPTKTVETGLFQAGPYTSFATFANNISTYYLTSYGSNALGISYSGVRAITQTSGIQYFYNVGGNQVYSEGNTFVWIANFTSGSSAGTSVEESWRIFLINVPSAGATSLRMRGTFNTTGVALTTNVSTFISNMKAGTSYTTASWIVNIGCGSPSIGQTGTTSGQSVDIGFNISFCDCPNPGYNVRPHIGNSNWGGINTATCGGPSQFMSVVVTY
jgi:hypothetical protein